MAHTESTATRAVAISVVVSVGIGLVMAWFAWPATQLQPRDLPVVVAGPAPMADRVAERLRTARAGAFDVTVVPDEAAADRALRQREAYAAFVVGSDGVSLHTATAAAPAVAALLTAAGQELGQGKPVPSVDVVPTSPDDPRGAGFASGLLPLVLAGLVAAVLLVLLVSHAMARLLGVVLLSVLVGAVGAAVLTWLGVVVDAYASTFAVVALVALAVGAAVTGLGTRFGRPGVALGVLVVFLFGNPISAAAAAPELLPQPWGAVGQLLPPGAGASLLRGAVYFDWAGASTPLWTLVAWAAGGLLLIVAPLPQLGSLRRGEQPRVDPRSASGEVAG